MNILLRNLLAGTTLLLTGHALPATPAPHDESGFLSLHYSDGSPPSKGLSAVNARLREIGVRVSQVDLPASARPILAASVSRALSPAESAGLLRIFALDRRDLLEQIRLAGRSPATVDGGSLSIGEIGVPRYPKIYDMRSLTPAQVVHLQGKFGRLHVNSADSGEGIDEVMTIVSGGPYTWFFVLKDNVVGKLRLGRVAKDGPAWRISYPGLVPHGGYFDAPDGLVVAHAHGPEVFVMRYEARGIEGAETLNDNPWIDFAGARPVLLDRPRGRQTVSGP